MQCVIRHGAKLYNLVSYSQLFNQHCGAAGLEVPVIVVVTDRKKPHATFRSIKRRLDVRRKLTPITEKSLLLKTMMDAADFGASPLVQFTGEGFTWSHGAIRPGDRPASKRSLHAGVEP